MIINLLCPTRGRPDKYERMVESAKDTAFRPDSVNFQPIFFGNDPLWIKYKGSYSKSLFTSEVMGRGAGPYWNLAAAKTIDPRYETRRMSLYMLIGDDCVFETKCWDDMIRVEAAKYPDGIFAIAPNDNRSGGAPHFVVSNKWIETLGYFVHPAFQHFCVDTWTEYLARAVDRFIYMPDVIVSHQKAAEQHYDETADRIRGKNRVNLRDNLIKDLLIKNGFAKDDIDLLKAAMA